MPRATPDLQIVYVKRTGLPQRQKRIEGVWVRLPEGNLKELSVATAAHCIEVLVCNFFVVKDGERIRVRINRGADACSYLETFRGSDGTDDLYDLDECP
jgi:hypothetical protein